MSGRAGQNKKPKSYYFHPEWEEDLFSTMSYLKCFCLICQSTIAFPKTWNVELHFRTVHKMYDNDQYVEWA